MADKDDKPAHLLEISKGAEKDIEKWQAGKGEAPPVEHFLPDSALAEIERATKARDEPVRADQLIPIHLAEAARRRTQHGEVLPKMPAQRRVIPAPFQRPRVTGGTHGKTWQSVHAADVAEGDIVPGVGQVTGIRKQLVYVTREDVRAGRAFTGPVTVDPGEDNVVVGEAVLLTGAGGMLRAFKSSAMVQVFRKAV